MSARYSLGEPIAALATPHGQSALCILRLSGEGICASAHQFFSAASRLSSHGMTYGYFLDEEGRAMDEVMVASFPCPRSYTGEDVLEIYAHGNMYLARSLLDRLFRLGYRAALPGEFTYRAVLLGKMDMIKAEAVHELICARSSAGMDHALSRLRGDLSHLLQPIYQRLLEISSFLRMHLDYPEDEIETLPYFDLSLEKERLENLLHHSRNLERWTDGAVVVIAGSPNVGKSSLFNLLLQQDRALVSDVAGTTRDYLEADIQLGGFPIRLIDTAGLHASEDKIEALGIQKSVGLLHKADLIIHVTDIRAEGDLPELTAHQEKVLRVMNKADLGDAPAGHLAISVLRHQGIEELRQHILAMLDFQAVGQGNEALMLGSVRQKKLCTDALEHLCAFMDIQEQGDLDAMAFHMQQAGTALADLLGKNLHDEVNAAMFSGFCLGK